MGIACYGSVHTFLRLCGCSVLTIIPPTLSHPECKACHQTTEALQVAYLLAAHWLFQTPAQTSSSV